MPLSVEPRFVVAAALVGVVGFAGSFVLYNYAIATVQAAPAAVIINLIPAVGLGSAVTLLGEPLTVYAVVGALLICGSVAIFAALEALAQPLSSARAVVGAPDAGDLDLDLDLDLRVLVDDVELPQLTASVQRAG